MIEKYFIYFLTCSNLSWTSSFTRGESARTKTYSPIKYFIACYKNDFKPLSWFLLFWHRDKNTAWLTFSVKCVFFSIKRIYMGVTKNGSWIKDNIIELMKLVFIKGMHKGHMHDISKQNIPPPGGWYPTQSWEILLSNR